MNTFYHSEENVHSYDACTLIRTVHVPSLSKTTSLILSSSQTNPIMSTSLSSAYNTIIIVHRQTETKRSQKAKRGKHPHHPLGD